MDETNRNNSDAGQGKLSQVVGRGGGELKPCTKIESGELGRVEGGKRERKRESEREFITSSSDFLDAIEIM